MGFYPSENGLEEFDANLKLYREIESMSNNKKSKLISDILQKYNFKMILKNDDSFSVDEQIRFRGEFLDISYQDWTEKINW